MINPIQAFTISLHNMNKANIILSHLIWIATLILSIIIAIGIFHNPAGFMLNISIALFIAFLSILFYSRAIFYSKKQLENIYSKKLLLSNIILQIFSTTTNPEIYLFNLVI